MNINRHLLHLVYYINMLMHKAVIEIRFEKKMTVVTKFSCVCFYYILFHYENICTINNLDLHY